MSSSSTTASPTRNLNLITATEVTIEWLARVTGNDYIEKVECEDLAKAGGLSGELTRLRVDFSNETPSTTYVLKCTKKGTEATLKGPKRVQNQSLMA